MTDGKKTTYSPAFKEEAVMLFLKGGCSYRQLCEEFGIKDKKTLREWVAKISSGESLEDGRGKSSHAEHCGRPKTKFSPVEELVYVKAERDYLKKFVSLTIRARMGSAPKRVLFKIIDGMRIYSSLKALLHFSGLSRSGYMEDGKPKNGQ